MSFVAYLTNLRIRKAAALLRETDLRNSYQIGERVGIPDPHYFSHVFKKDDRHVRQRIPGADCPRMEKSGCLNFATSCR